MACCAISEVLDDYVTYCWGPGMDTNTRTRPLRLDETLDNPVRYLRYCRGLTKYQDDGLVFLKYMVSLHYHTLTLNMPQDDVGHFYANLLPVNRRRERCIPGCR